MNREKKIQQLCERFLFEHKEIRNFISGFRNFISGFGEKEKCECKGCQIARELLKESQ